MISCASIEVNCSPSSFLSNTFCIWNRHSFKGSGPGALPPTVINSAPFGLISRKSKTGLAVVIPK